MDTIELKLRKGETSNLDKSWTEIMRKYKGKGDDKDQFIVNVCCDGFSDSVQFVLRENDLYVIGVYKGEGSPIVKFPSTTYVGNENPGINTESVATMLHFFRDYKQGMDKTKDFGKNLCLAAFIISEAARFDFVRAVVKRVYGDESVKKDFLNWEESAGHYLQIKNYKELLTNYGKIKKTAETGPGKTSENISILSTRNYFYKQGKENPKQYQDLVYVGLLGKWKLFGNNPPAELACFN